MKVRERRIQTLSRGFYEPTAGRTDTQGRACSPGTRTSATSLHATRKDEHTRANTCYNRRQARQDMPREERVTRTANHRTSTATITVRQPKQSRYGLCSRATCDPHDSRATRQHTPGTRTAQTSHSNTATPLSLQATHTCTQTRIVAGTVTKRQAASNDKFHRKRLVNDEPRKRQRSLRRSIHNNATTLPDGIPERRPPARARHYARQLHGHRHHPHRRQPHHHRCQRIRAHVAVHHRQRNHAHRLMARLLPRQQ